MRVTLGLLVVLGVPVIAAAQDDPLVGQVVFARFPDVELRTEDGGKYGPLGSSPVRVVSVLPSGRVRVENVAEAGTGVAWTRRADVVKQADALAHFSAHVRAHPDDPWGYEMRASVHYELRDYNKGVDDLDEAIRLGQTAARHILRGLHRAALRDNVGAVEDFSSAHRLEPTNTLPLLQRGRVYTGMKEFAKAEADLNQTLQLHPGYTLAYHARGLMWDERGEYGKAIQDFTEAIRLAPQFAAAYADRGRARLGVPDPAAAATDYAEAARLEPASSAFHYGLGYSLEHLKDYDKARAAYAEAARLRPSDPLPHLGLGNVWANKSDTEKAVAAYTQAIRRDPKFGEAFGRRAKMWDTLGDFEKAVADYAEVIRLNPQDTVYTNSYAWLLATCPEDEHRDGAKAVELATRLCERSMGKVAVHLDTLAAAHAEVGDFDKAVEAQKKVLALPGVSVSEVRHSRERLKLYEAGRPYRQPPRAKKD